MHCQLSPQGTMPCGCKTTLAALFLLFFTAYLFKKIAMYWACPCGPYLEYLTHPLLIKDWQNLIEKKIKKGKCVKFQGQMWQISMANASNINGKCVKIDKGKCANGKWTLAILFITQGSERIKGTFNFEDRQRTILDIFDLSQQPDCVFWKQEVDSK